jgi:hypothetical protein
MIFINPTEKVLTPKPEVMRKADKIAADYAKQPKFCATSPGDKRYTREGIATIRPKHAYT